MPDGPFTPAGDFDQPRGRAKIRTRLKTGHVRLRSANTGGCPPREARCNASRRLLQVARGEELQEMPVASAARKGTEPVRLSGSRSGGAGSQCGVM